MTSIPDPVRRPGRPRELTARELEDIEKLLLAGQTVAAIARALRRPWSTVRAAIARMDADKAESPAALASDPGGATHEEGTVQSDHTSTDAGVNGKASEEEK